MGIDAYRGRLRDALTSPRERMRTAVRSRLLELGPFAVALAAYVVAFIAMQPDPTGDEPHYLLVAQSIALDGDIDLRNDYASRERTLNVFQEFPLQPHASRYPGSDALLPWHGVGLSVLLAPAVGLGGLTLARLLMVLLAAVFAQQLYRLLIDVGAARRPYRYLAWMSVVLCLPLLTFSSQVYPEVPGALLVVCALRVLVMRKPTAPALIGAGLAGGALPWLHVRYLPITATIALGLAYVGTRRFTSEPSRFSERLWKLSHFGVKVLPHRLTHVWGALMPLVVSLAVMAGAFEVWYGSPNPTTPYRSFFGGTIGSGGWTFWYDYLLPDLLHPAYGWIPYAPVHWLGFAGLGYLLFRFGWRAAAILAAAVAYAALVASAAVPLGLQFPGRIIIVVGCLIVVPLALVIDRFRVARFFFAPLFAVSLAFAVVGVLRHEMLYPSSRTQSEARLPGVRSIRTAFPYAQPRIERASVQPGEMSPLVGRLADDRVVASTTRGDPPGFVIWGSYRSLDPATYNASFSLAARRAPKNRPVATIEIVSPTGGIPLAQRPVFVAELDGSNLTPVVLPFGVPSRAPLEARVLFHGNGTLSAGSIEITRVTPAERFPDWPLVFVWVAGTALVGALLVELARGRSRA